jgi:hypothetical protein
VQILQQGIPQEPDYRSSDQLSEIDAHGSKKENMRSLSNNPQIQ